MTYNVVMPQLGLTMEEGSVVSWRKKPGDWVEKGEVLFVVETDKAEMDVESTDSGYLSSISVEVGKKVPVGTVIAILANQQGEIASPEQGEAAQAVSPAQPQEAGAPESNLEPQAVQDVPAGGAPAPQAESLPRREFAASPRARRLAGQLGIDISAVRPRRGQRIVEEDVRRFQAGREKTPERAPVAEVAETPLRASLTRQVVAERMTESFHSAPHFYLGVEANATILVSFREQLRDRFQRLSGLKLTYTDLFLRALALALKDHPQVNAYWQKDSVQSRDSIAVAFAVQTPEGLLAPVIGKADKLTLYELATQRAALTEKAKAGKLSLQEMEGGSATLTNLGSFGVDWFQAILNPPQSVILATGRICKRPMVVSESLIACPTLLLSLSVDHRVLDGVAAASFLGRIKELLESPYLMTF